MGIFRLVLTQAHRPDPPRLMAQHLDTGWLKQRGYEIARSLGDQAALWTPPEAGSQQLTLRCRSGHALTIVKE